MGDEAPTDAELVHAYRARNLPSWLLLQTARAKHDGGPTFRVRNAIRKLEKTDTYPACRCACSLPVEPPEAPEAPQNGGTGGNGPSTEREGKPFPWKALHFAHFIGELNKQLEVPVLESVEAFETMADNRHVAQMSCVLPAPLALVLYQRDPDFIADWFTWREQIANG